MMPLCMQDVHISDSVVVDVMGWMILFFIFAFPVVILLAYYLGRKEAFDEIEEKRKAEIRKKELPVVRS